jgi:hypothetical protein
MGIKVDLQLTINMHVLSTVTDGMQIPWNLRMSFGCGKYPIVKIDYGEGVRLLTSILPCVTACAGGPRRTARGLGP